NYTRAIHDESEYEITNLAMYEYEVGNPSAPKRVFTYDKNSGSNSLKLNVGENGAYSFSIQIPAEYDGSKYSYLFVANDPEMISYSGALTDLKGSLSDKIIPSDGPSSAKYNGGILSAFGMPMTGIAKVNSEEEFVMESGLTCSVELVRAVSRIDMKYEVPNLKLTNVEFRGCPQSGYLFAQSAVTTPSAKRVTLNLSEWQLPSEYLQNIEDQKEWKCEKAFYVYERPNTETDSAIVHIEYEVWLNDQAYPGSVDIPFKRTSGDGAYVDILRNHRYTIVLGNGDEAIGGKVTAKLIFDEWEGNDYNDSISDEDPVKDAE
ncbi:MAG: hypothetical protein K2M41_05485, partial [Muribaculaceae bacterium]|nr:hypothetical protein [Muribaculaceae bacterium]